MDRTAPNPQSEVACFIRAVRQALKMTQDEFAAAYACTKGNVSAWENGRHEPPYVTLAAMSDHSGTPLPQAAQGADDAPRPIMRPKSRRDVVLFEHLDVQAACGDGFTNDDYPMTLATLETSLEFAQRIIGSLNRSGLVRIFTAYGDSMVPTIAPEDLLFVDTGCTEMRGEGIYLIFHGNGLVCKRLHQLGKRIEVASDNPLYKPWNWDERDESTHIVGKLLASMPIRVVRHGM